MRWTRVGRLVTYPKFVASRPRPLGNVIQIQSINLSFAWWFCEETSLVAASVPWTSSDYALLPIELDIPGAMWRSEATSGSLLGMKTTTLWVYGLSCLFERLRLPMSPFQTCSVPQKKGRVSSLLPLPDSTSNQSQTGKPKLLLLEPLDNDRSSFEDHLQTLNEPFRKKRPLWLGVWSSGGGG